MLENSEGLTPGGRRVAGSNPVIPTNAKAAYIVAFCFI